MYTDYSGYLPEWIEITGIVVLAAAIVVVAILTAGAVIGAAPAIAGFAQSAVFTYIGSATLASAAASAVSIGAGVLAVSSVAIGVNESASLLTGNNFLRNTMGDSAYNGFSSAVGLLSYGYIMGGCMLPYPSTSTGTEPGSLNSQVVMNSSMRYPNSGTSLHSMMPMNDPRMPGYLGWTKYQMSFDGNTVHYVGNRYLNGWWSPYNYWFDYKFTTGGN